MTKPGRDVILHGLPPNITNPNNIRLKIVIIIVEKLFTLKGKNFIIIFIVVVVFLY